MHKFVLILLVFLLYGTLAQGILGQRIAPAEGIWSVSGKDIEKTNWKGSLTLKRKRVFNRSITYSGRFSWRSADGEAQGFEYFTGRFYRKTGLLVLKGYAVKIQRGDLAAGEYKAFVSNRGRKIRGSWAGENIAEGNWLARWIKR